MVYVISYDLNEDNKNYPCVIQAIKDASNGLWCDCLKSTWVIKSELDSAAKVYDVIKPCLDSDDTCIVFEVRNNKQGQLEKKHNDKLIEIFS